MNHNITNRGGFSLVELMVTCIIVSILALTFGSMLFFAYKSWRQNEFSVALQQDAYTTMRKIAREVRLTQEGEITLNSPTRITLGANENLSIPERSFSVSVTGDLLFNDSAVLIPADSINAITFTDGIEVEEPPNSIEGLQVGLSLTNKYAAFGMTNLFFTTERNL